MKHIGLLLAIVCFACDNDTNTTTDQTGFQANSVTVQSGKENFLKIRVTGVTKLCEARVVMTYDPSTIEITNITPGPFIGDNRGRVIGPLSKSTPGKLDVTIGVAEGSQFGVTGSGEILRIYVKGLNSGQTHFTFDQNASMLIDCNLAMLPIQYFEDGNITVR